MVESRITRETWVSLGSVAAVALLVWQVSEMKHAILDEVAEGRAEVVDLRNDMAQWIEVFRAIHPELGLPPFEREE